MSPLVAKPVLEYAGGELVQVRWNGDDRGVVGGEGWEGRMEGWFEAVRKWEAILRSEESELWTKMEPGTAISKSTATVAHSTCAREVLICRVGCSLRQPPRPARAVVVLGHAAAVRRLRERGRLPEPTRGAEEAVRQGAGGVGSRAGEDGRAEEWRWGWGLGRVLIGCIECG